MALFPKLSLLKAVAKRLPLLFANAFKSIKERQLLLSQIVGRAITIWEAKKNPGTNLQNLYKNKSKEIKSENFCYRKVEGAITKWGAIEKSSILLSP